MTRPHALQQGPKLTFNPHQASRSHTEELSKLFFVGAAERQAFAQKRMRELRREAAELDRKLMPHKIALAALKEVKSWAESATLHIEAPSGHSQWHHLRDSRTSGNVYAVGFDDTTGAFFRDEPQVFVVAHDWAAAFNNAKDYAGGEVRLPFEECVFEFAIGGRRVLAVCKVSEGEAHYIVCVRTAELWLMLEGGPLLAPAVVDEAPFSRLIRENIRAVCVALDAEVATTEPVRAPYRLNLTREKQGKLPINSFHIVSLARRSRAAPMPLDGEVPAHRVRLHFRRGHWRHYETHKTWIKWTMVGDPDLGFIDKHYRA